MQGHKSPEMAFKELLRYANIYHCPADVLRLLPPEKLEEWLEEQREAENLLKVGGDEKAIWICLLFLPRSSWFSLMLFIDWIMNHVC